MMPQRALHKAACAFLGILLVSLSLPAQAGCREDAIEAAKACMSDDLEAGMQDQSEEAQRIYGELNATGKDIKNLNRQGDLYKKLAAQSKRGSLLAAMKANACSKAFKACSSSCEAEQDEPRSQEAYSACKRIGGKNAKLAEQQAGHLLDNMQTNEAGLAGTATLIEHPEGKTGNSACNDSYSSPECSSQSLASQASGSGPRTHSPEQYYTATAVDPVTGEESGGGFHFDGRFETASDNGSSSVFNGGGSSSAALDGGAGDSRFDPSVASLAPPQNSAGLVAARLASNVDREAVDDGDDEVKDGSKKKSLKKRALKVIQGLMSFVSGGRITLSPLDSGDPARTPRVSGMVRKAKGRSPATSVAGEPSAVLQKDGVTSATGMSLFEKIHRQYQMQEASLAQD